MQKRKAFGPDDVERITVYGSQVTVDHVGWPYQPQGLTSAQLNLPYCVATLLLEGDVFVAQFTEAMVSDPARIALSRRVQTQEDPAITARGSRYRHMVRVEVRLNDGTIMEETREAPVGSEDSFATADDVIAKFRKLVEPTMASADVERMVDQVMGMERLDAVGDLVRCLTATKE
jgi:2-methylcitrate dehydratase PrpD